MRSVRCKVIEIHIARDHSETADQVLGFYGDEKVTLFRTSDTGMVCLCPMGRSGQHILHKIRNELPKEQTAPYLYVPLQ